MSPKTMSMTMTKALAVLAFSGLVMASPTARLAERQTAPYLGCFTEADGIRALSSLSTVNGETMTPAVCEDFCFPEFLLYGVEYGSECYCGNTLESGSLKVVETDCNMACAGDAGEICGAGNRLSVYGDENAIPPEAIPGYIPPAQADYLGCYTEGNGTRALTGASLVIGTMTLDLCAQYCFDVKGYSILGLEYGSECYCGDALHGSSTLADPADCNMPCAGNAGEICGAGNRLSVWQSNSTSS